jgi:hypothetical protein
MSIVLRHKDEDGVEFFTLDSTGESGMSISGLAKLCGKPRMTVYDAVQKAVDGISKAEHLKSLQGKAIQLTVGSSYKNVSVIKDTDGSLQDASLMAAWLHTIYQSSMSS